MILIPTKQTNLYQKNEEKEKNWYLIDAKNQILGRLASKITSYLIGKHKKDFVPHLDRGDYVVVINVGHIKITGRKIDQKNYQSYSGYPGGLKKVSLKELLIKKPEEVVHHAVWGMLPKNKLRKQRIKRLFIFKDEKHHFQDKSLIIIK